MSELRIKVGDTRPWNTTLTSAGDDDLTDVASAVLFMRPINSTTNKINGSVVVVGTLTTTTAPMLYNPLTADVDTAGEFDLYWLVTFTTGAKVARWPSEGFDRVVIEPNFE